MITEKSYLEALKIVNAYRLQLQQPPVMGSGCDDDDEQCDESEPCPTCGDIDGMVNPCCAGYDPLHYRNCGYG